MQYPNQTAIVVNGPVPVWVQITFINIKKVNGVEEEFTADFYFMATWPDASACAPGTTPDDTPFDASNAWLPALDFININGPATAYVTNPYTLTVFPKARFEAARTNPAKMRNITQAAWGNCWVNFDQRYTGGFSTSLNLEEFPYDKQYVLITLESQSYDTKKLQVCSYLIIDI